jgi:hypothetical protein
MIRLSDVSPARLALGTAAALLLLGSAPVMGHSLLVLPKPRDMQDGYKDPPRAPPGTGAPCGVMRAATQPQTTYVAGQPLHVQWSETITHPGCFVIDFASANDASFQVLGVKSHSTAAGGTPRPWSLDVTLPSAPCAACTLRLRQLMLAADVPESQCPPATIPLGATYYSCSNVTLTGTGTAGAPDGGTADARADAGGPGRGGSSSDGATPASSGGAPGSTATGGSTVASGGSTMTATATGGATIASSGGASGATGGSSAAPSGTGGASASASSANNGGCSVSGAPSSASMISIVSALCLAGAFIVKRRRPSDPKTKERVQ